MECPGGKKLSKLPRSSPGEVFRVANSKKLLISADDNDVFHSKYSNFHRREAYFQISKNDCNWKQHKHSQKVNKKKGLGIFKKKCKLDFFNLC